MKELSQKIDSYVVVLNEDNSTTTTPAEMQGATQPTLSSTPLFASEAPLASPAMPDNTNIWFW